MKTKYFFYGLISFITNLSALNVFSQALKGYSFKIVNMQPKSQSNEINFDSETNIAVDPSNPSTIAGSAFTPNPTGSLTTAPIYISTDEGNTWALNNILPSGNGYTADISLGFGATSGTLYSGILRGGSSFRNMMLRTTTPTEATTMTTLLDRSTISIDQPFISATTTDDATSIHKDRFFSGDNWYGNRISVGGTGKTAEVLVSNDGGSSPFSGLAVDEIEDRTTSAQDFPAIRTAIHNSGVVYAVFYRWTSGSSSPYTCDVVVTRDDNFATGTAQFQALIDAGDLIAGQRVVTSIKVPAFGIFLGNNRLVGSNLAIAVDPDNSANVVIAWCDRVGTTDYTIHFRRSKTSGRTWDGSDWLTITNATNPGIAIANSGKVGLIYQQLTGSGTTAKWETHFRLANFSGTTFSDEILSTFLDSDLGASTFIPSLGDYLRIQAVGNNFYGVFPASNRPVSTNFPDVVSYQRNADFTTNQLRDITNTSNIAVSVDPFFFRISPSILISLCVLYPQACKVKYLIPNNIIHISPYPCLRCPWPCLQCPPFEIPLGDIYEQVYAKKAPQTVLTSPYFHLSLDGLIAKDFNISIVTSDGEPIAQQMNKTDKGYTISFRTTENNFNTREGIHGLKLLVTPKNASAAKKGAEFKYRFQASDYRFKEFTAMGK
jgi:hypothetical protein